MPKTSMEAPFKVVIVGGSVAGLTLAHCLHRANIEYVVLEKRVQIAPQEGASIGLWPTGGQILDQLGLWKDVTGDAEAILCHNLLFPDGYAFTHFMLERVYERLGYGLVFVSRQQLLESLYRNLPDKTRVHINQAVVEIQQTEEGVFVVTQDGTTYSGSLVVGADGVHSRVRSEMWRLEETQYPGLIGAKEKQTLTAEFACVFGISDAIPGLPAREHVNVYGNGYAVLTFHGSDSIFWFVLSRMDRVYMYPDVPRFTADDAEELCTRRYADVSIADGVCVRDLWENKKAASMTAMEEGVFETWSAGRIVLVGDAVRKMTVTMGQGANTTIEDSAVLATVLHKLVHERSTKTNHPTSEEIATALVQFQALRYPRSKTIYEQTKFSIRTQTRSGFAKRVMGRYIMPSKIDHMTDGLSELMADGPVVGFLPLPERSTDGWEKYSSDSRKDAAKQGATDWVQWSVVSLSVVLAVSLLARYRAVWSWW
ncbi:monooxygenase [Aspergillus pseudoustus]|uniref:Monooxygenase n=1 Tax=Aspergillus pseudoustus TaxID=1810923 RepID=A0ABR4KFJ8_9EURO